MTILLAAERPERVGGHDAAWALLRLAAARLGLAALPEIARAPGEKPRFAGRDDLFFSLSHTRTHVLCALADRDVGADVETRRTVPDRLRDRLFTTQEQRDFDFFEGWTLREAVYKLTGEGSLMHLRIMRSPLGVLTPFPGVRCRSYDDIPGCAAALATRDAELPARIELVPPAAILSCYSPGRIV